MSEKVESEDKKSETVSVDDNEKEEKKKQETNEKEKQEEEGMQAEETPSTALLTFCVAVDASEFLRLSPAASG